MNLRATILLLPLLVTVLFPPTADAEADFLDIKALSLEPVGPVYATPGWGQPSVPPHPLNWAKGSPVVMKEGEWIGLRCDWSMDVVDKGTYWEMKKGPWDNQWPGRFEDNGVAFHTFTITIPYGTAVGELKQESGLSSPCFPDFWNECKGPPLMQNFPPYHKSYTLSPGGGLGFGAKGLGKHTIRCVLNNPKSFSDRNPNNNVAELTIFVTPK